MYSSFSSLYFSPFRAPSVYSLHVIMCANRYEPEIGGHDDTKAALYRRLLDFVEMSGIEPESESGQERESTTRSQR